MLVLGRVHPWKSIPFFSETNLPSFRPTLDTTQTPYVTTYVYYVCENYYENYHTKSTKLMGSESGFGKLGFKFSNHIFLKQLPKLWKKLIEHDSCLFHLSMLVSMFLFPPLAVEIIQLFWAYFLDWVVQPLNLGYASPLHYQRPLAFFSYNGCFAQAIGGGVANTKTTDSPWKLQC